MKYKDFQPTGFDPKGLGLEDQQDWIVAPVSRTRDTGPLEESNFETALEILGGESDTVEIHRFGHWGPGWFEIILVHPSRESEVDAIEGALEDYPVLNDEDYSEREYEQALESWDNWSCRDFRKAVVEAFGLSDMASDLLDEIDNDVLWRFHMDNAPYGYETHDDGPCFYFDYLETQKHPTRNEIACLLRGAR